MPMRISQPGFRHRPEDAITHYDIAIRIAELSLPPDFTELLPWGFIYNRPFLRAFHGYGLCLWRLDQAENARAVFERILSLNPADHQGVRFCWNDIRNGHPWRSDARVAGGLARCSRHWTGTLDPEHTIRHPRTSGAFLL